MPAPRVSPCPNCSSSNLFRSRKPVSAGGGYAPNYLPGLGRLLMSARLDIVVCRDCGLTRAFAHRDATARLADSGRWERA